MKSENDVNDKWPDFSHEAGVIINLEFDGLSATDYLSNLFRQWGIELIRSECSTCGKGSFPAKRAWGGYAHRNDGKIWIRCKCSNIWAKLPEEIV